MSLSSGNATSTAARLRSQAPRVLAWLSPRIREGRRRAANWAMYPGDKTAPPRILRYLLTTLVVIVVSAICGVITAQATANFGPHDAHYAVTIDSSITLDAGPLGSLVIDSPLPVGLGVHAAIGEIPDSLTSVDSKATLAALGQDLEGYVQFFAAPSETISLVAKLLIADAIKRALIVATALVAAGFALRYVLGYSLLGCVAHCWIRIYPSRPQRSPSRGRSNLYRVRRNGTRRRSNHGKAIGCN